MAFTVTSFHFLLGLFFGGKERKAQGLAFGFNLLYGYLSQQQHFIANPPLPALFKKELARFHVSHQCLNVCIYSKTERHL
jgi:hypothetical protein